MKTALVFLTYDAWHDPL